VGSGYISENNLLTHPSSTSPLGALSCPACGLVLRAPDGPLPTGTPGRIALRAALPQPIAAAVLLAGTLSPREQTAFELLGLGYDNRSIARELQISERTTKRHVTAILKKLKLESRLQAGLTAIILSSCSPETDSVAPKSYGQSQGPNQH
jgi:DNA-binding CsgD family transcriptional regulator